MLSKILITGFTVLVLSNISNAQTSVSWGDLMDITFKDVYLESDDIYVYFPLFKEKQKVLADKEVSITGYIIPIDIETNLYVLSAFPFSACFFCGAAGPESVMAVYFKSDDLSFKTDDRLTLTGRFELNDSDVNELIYILQDAEIKAP
ncbi:MAG: DUF3299 domain-containing protein [Flavobacteriales bacterium]|nr:DUF3299 domain-containing protein [Flavobacteriales bacterium]